MTQVMTGDLDPNAELQKAEWLNNLAIFIVEANKNTWAAEGKEIVTERPGYIEFEYVSPDEKWRLRDSFTGYFRAPGMTTVYYRGKDGEERPVWTMQYGGHGMTEGYEPIAANIFGFLKSALMQVTPESPFRGPESYEALDGSSLLKYSFRLLRGDITDALWEESITQNGIMTFTQTGLAGIVLHADATNNLVYPWNL